MRFALRVRAPRLARRTRDHRLHQARALPIGAMPFARRCKPTSPRGDGHLPAGATSPFGRYANNLRQTPRSLQAWNAITDQGPRESLGEIGRIFAGGKTNPDGGIAGRLCRIERHLPAGIEAIDDRSTDRLRANERDLTEGRATPEGRDRRQCCCQIVPRDPYFGPCFQALSRPSVKKTQSIEKNLCQSRNHLSPRVDIAACDRGARSPRGRESCKRQRGMWPRTSRGGKSKGVCNESDSDCGLR
jgi:hypothetical protein